MSRKLPDDAASLMVFAVLAALAKKSMGTAEVSRALLTNRLTARTHLQELERLGWIVRRARDNRWVMRVLLAPLEVPEPTGLPGETPKLNPKRSLGPVLGHGFTKPVVAPGDPQKLLTPPDKPDEPGEPQDWRSASERLSEQWSLPLRLKSVDGEMGTGKRSPCIHCGTLGIIRYGDTPVCPKCARTWEEKNG